MKSSHWLLVFTLLTVAAHGFGTLFHWYETLGWYDILVHLVGGAWVALIISHVLKRKGWRVVCAVLVVTLLWEAFEFTVGAYIRGVYHVTTGLQPGLLDTASDILFGTLGAALAAWFLL